MTQARLSILENKTATVRTNGARVRYMMHRTPQAEHSCVMIPGWNVPPEFWQPLAIRLAAGTGRRFNFLMIENIGFGGSTLGRGITPRNYLEQNACAILEVMDIEGIVSAHFAVHSMGGYAPKKILLKEPNRVASVVFICTPLLDPLSSFVVGNALLTRLSIDALAWYAYYQPHMIDGIKGNPEWIKLATSLIRTHYPSFLKTLGVTKANAEDFVRYTSLTSVRTIALAFLAMRLEGTMIDALPTIERPSLYIAGGQDWVVKTDHIKDISHWDSGSQLHIIEDAGHTPMSTHARITARTILEFYRTRGIVTPSLIEPLEEAAL